MFVSYVRLFQLQWGKIFKKLPCYHFAHFTARTPRIFYLFYLFISFFLQNKLQKKTKTNTEYLIKVHMLLILSEMRLNL